ncbi:MAG: AAA family ATPase [Polyangiaceae bacterium]|nr:AAA family ATPase [Polyangiaceae bacterium]
MIRHLTLKDVGPARDLKFAFSPRLNVLTGDNGLGKTFVLDVLWWVLTTTWAGEKAFPWRPPEPERAGPEPSPEGQPPPDTAPGILAVLTKRAAGGDVEEGVATAAAWHWETQEWLSYSPGRPHPDAVPPQARHLLDEAADRPASLVIYARIDGSYAVWDAHYVKGGIASSAEAAIVLKAGELWDGKEVADSEVQGGKRTVIGGLIADWVNWQQRSRSPEFEALRRVLTALSSPDEPLVPGEPTRVHLRDRRDIPTLSTSYGVVPVTLASAGVRRALSLAYLLVWAWTEHAKASKQSRRPPTRDVVLLIDEPELHQHPAWQRVFLPAILTAVGTIAPNAAVQVFAATHSPLVLASLEPHFDPALDTLFTFDVMPRAHRVKVEKVPWRPRGDVSNWLTSDVFDLGYARSREAEEALKKAVKVLDKPELTDEEARKVHRDLHAALGDTDPFWARWLSYARAKGIEL